MSLTRRFVRAAKLGHYQIVESLIKMRGVDVTANNNEAFALACESVGDDVRVVELLMKDARIDTSLTEDRFRNYNSEFVMACRRGNLELVRLFMNHPKVDVTTDDNRGFIEACDRSHLHVVKLLSTNEKVRANMYCVRGFLKSCETGQSKIVKFFIRDKHLVPNRSIMITGMIMAFWKDCASVGNFLKRKITKLDGLKSQKLKTILGHLRIKHCVKSKHLE